MTTAQVVETSVTINNNSPIQDYVHPDDQTQPTFEDCYIVYCLQPIKNKQTNKRTNKTNKQKMNAGQNPSGYRI